MASLPAEDLQAPRVRLPQGTYKGRVVSAAILTDPTTPSAVTPTAVDAFLGVPYAQSTAGAHRFAAPVPLAVAPGDADVVHGATALGQRCPGTALEPALLEGEECLNANVYRPAGWTEGDGLLPVVIYVHSGSFNKGMGAERDMASFVAYARGRVVAVSFNFRLGALGFLGLLADASTGEECPDAPLNVGLLDQQALFAWVQANIGRFGGDAGNVTIMGLSAGAHAVAHHMLCYPRGQAPFHKVISESGAATARAIWSAAHPRPQAQLRAFLAAAGVPPTAPASVALAALRALPLSVVMVASRRVWDDYAASVCWPFQPVVGGRVIRATPTEVWRSGVRPGLPVLTGFASHEGTYFVPGDRARADTDAHFRAFFRTLLPDWADETDAAATADVDALCQLYPDPTAAAATAANDAIAARYVNPDPPPPDVTGRQWARLEAAYAHHAYICPVLQTAHFVSGLADGNASGPSAPVFVYEFAALGLAWNRANHGENQVPVAHNVADAPLGHQGLRGNAGLTAVSDAMHGAWVAFATAPSAEALQNEGLEAGGLAWKPWTPAAQPVLVFGAGNDERVPAACRHGGAHAKKGTVAALRTLTEHERKQCAFWWARRGLCEGMGRQ